MFLRSGSTKSTMIHERSAISLPPFMASRSYAMPVHACVAVGSVSSTVKRCGLLGISSVRGGGHRRCSLRGRRAVISMK